MKLTKKHKCTWVCIEVCLYFPFCLNVLRFGVVYVAAEGITRPFFDKVFKEITQ